MPQRERPQKGIQSIEVGGQLLLALARHGAPMMLRDLAQAAGMAPAKAHPYLVSFGRLGLVEQDAATGRYRLGGTALQLGLVSLRQSDPVRLATEAIAALRERVRHTVALAVWGNRGPTVVRLEEMDYPFHANMRVGTVMSLARTATGHVFAAFLPDKMTEALLREELGQLARSETADAGPALRAALAETREHGMARALGSPIPGLNAFSAPVFDHTGAVVVALTVTGPSGDFDARWDSPIGAALLECCRDLSRRLGEN